MRKRIKRKHKREDKDVARRKIEKTSVGDENKSETRANKIYVKYSLCAFIFINMKYINIEILRLYLHLVYI